MEFLAAVVEGACPEGSCADAAAVLDLVRLASPDCPEGDLSEVSLFCSARLLGVSTALAKGSQRVDSMYPTDNRGYVCGDSNFNEQHYCQTDNRTLTVYLRPSLDSTAQSSVRWTLNESWDTTRLNVVYHSSSTVSYSGESETDIIYFSDPSSVPGDLEGVTWCEDAVEAPPPMAIRCDQHYVAFDASASRRLACHETGHAVGLTHGEHASPRVINGDDRLACMTTAPIESDNVGPHNTRQVDDEY